MKKKYLFIGIVFLLLFLISMRFITLIRWRQGTSGGEMGFRGLPDDADFGWWGHFDLPRATEKQKKAYCKMSEKEWEEYYREQNNKAQQLSGKLEDYILSWYYGKASAKLSDGLLPDTIDNEKTKDWTLLRPEQVKPEEQWMILPAHEISQDFSQLYGNNIDNKAIYLKLVFVAPLDSQLLIEGDFPYARFMDYQIIEPFDPKMPAGGNLGEMEVPLVDVDIEPDPGHTNPFKVGADRDAEKRHYHLTFDLKAGNSVELNPQVMKEPAFRSQGNKRVGGPFASAGPFFNGAIAPSVVWVRYYAPDKNAGILGGVSLPKVLLRLKTGEEFWLQTDFSLAESRYTTKSPAANTKPEEPFNFLGPSLGWLKIFDLRLIRAEAESYWRTYLLPNWIKNIFKKKIREDAACLFSRGPQVLPPGNYEPSATACAYNNYIARTFQLGEGKVYALTGRLPTTPKTRNSEPTMQKAQARYWSSCHYGRGEADQFLVYGCLMDDEITVDEQNDYIILYSRGKDRPSNAKAECGVTWQDFGPESRQFFTIRWMSVRPDHFMEEYSLDAHNIPWETGAWSQKNYDKTLVGENEPGAMGPYHPVIHYLSKEEFEALGCPIDPKKIPEWK